MPNVIQHKRNSTAGIIPSTGSLAQGELGINIGDGKLYTKNSSNVVINLGVTSISGTTITPASGNFTSLSVNGTGVISSSGGTTNYISKFTGSSTIGNSLVFDNGTNVGVGTATPNSKLEVNGEIAAGGTSAFTFAGNAWGYDKIIFRKDVNNKITTDSSGNYNWLVAGKNWTLSDVGKVGIGTISPAARLDIRDTGGSTDYELLRIGNNSNAADVGMRIGFWDDASGSYWGKSTGAITVRRVSSGSAGTMLFTTRDSQTTESAKMSILNGNVGIGTTTPSTLLEISKDGGGVDLALVRIANTNATGGTSLNISRTGGQRAAQVIYQSGTTNQFYQGILRDGGSTTNGWSVSAGADLNVTAPAIHVTSGNYVGIGTKSPQVLLHVNGQAYLQSLNLTGGTADRILATDTNKNVVGLNTSTYPTLTELSYVKDATSSIQTQLNTKAPLSSPAFTGTPTAPTAAGGTNTTQIATTAFVRTEISSLVDAAPGTLDTLNELAAALGDDPNFATTVTNSIATKQATITGGASTITSSNLTINRALISDSNGKVAVSDITNTELNYLDNASSNIQTQINTKIAYGEYSQSNPVFGQKGIKHNIVDNVLYSASDRFEFYIDNTLQSNNSLFNLGYDQVAAAFLPNATKIFRLVFNTKSNSATGITHPEGSVYLSFYYNATPASVSGRVKDKDGVWRNITNWTNVATNAPFYAVWRGTVPNNLYLVEMELTVVGGSVAIIGGDATWLSQIEYVMDRPGQFELGVLNKAQDATLWRNINFKNNSNTTTLSLTSAGNINLTSSTASRILSTDGSKNITALDTATYPSLTELSYVKGATSSIQTQINSKQNTLTNPVTGTGATGKIPKWSSTTALTDSIMSESSTVVNIAGSLNGQSDDSYLSFDANARRIGITKKGGFTGKFTYGSGNSFAIAQSNSGTIEATNTFTDRLVVDVSGNVGIGTAVPSARLEVAASGTTSLDVIHFSNSNGTERAKVSLSSAGDGTLSLIDASNNTDIFFTSNSSTASYINAGNFGIGMNNPSERIHVSGNQTTIRINNGLSYDTQLRLTDTASDWSVGINQGNSLGSGVFSIRSVTAGASRLVIDAGGNVGIGTTAPSDKLNVIGNISAGTISNTKGNFIAYGSAGQPNLLFEGFGSDGTARISTNSGSNRQLKIENDGASTTLGVYIEGDVGIGTTTPAYKLQVNGSFAASTKSFRIHHPSKKDHSLEYGSLESPYHGVRLTGRGTVIKGVGTVSLPDYLKDLIHDDDTLNIQITNIKHGKTIYIDKIDLQNDQFIVKVDRAKSLGELQFCWTLTGVRKDVDHLVVEKEN